MVLPIKKMATGPVGQASSLRLEGIGDLSALLDTPTAAASGGGPLMLKMDLIDEDPHQPRTKDNPGFSDESLDELASSIKLRGVKTPISVRDNQDAPGRYLINHGARRFRASSRAGKSVIPGFIDNDYNEADQIVENLQRNELTAREIADFIGRELAKGIKKGEIAKAISKSPAFVTQHVTLLDLPDPIAVAFNSERAKDVTVINELVTAYKKKPEEVTVWLGDENQEITRGSVKLLREFLDDKNKHDQQDGTDDKGGMDAGLAGEGTVRTDERFDDPAMQQGEQGGKSCEDATRVDNGAKKKDERLDDLDKLKKTIVQVRHNECVARLVLNRRPSAEGFAWLKYDGDGQEFEANLSSVTLIALVEG